MYVKVEDKNSWMYLGEKTVADVGNDLAATNQSSIYVRDSDTWERLVKIINGYEGLRGKGNVHLYLSDNPDGIAAFQVRFVDYRRQHYIIVAS